MDILHAAQEARTQENLICIHLNYQLGEFLAQIVSGDELVAFLRKAKEIEDLFETTVQWEGYIDVKKDEFREILFKLISDSDKHANWVDKLISMVKTTQGAVASPIAARTFNFKNKNEMEIMMDIGKYEKLIHDLYKNINDGLDEAVLRNILKDGNQSSEFISTLRQLIAEEQGHINLVSRFVGKIERIR